MANLMPMAMPQVNVPKKKNFWISHNKFLVGNGKKVHARNPNFDTDETHLLISLWGDPKVQKTLITTHKKSPIIEKLAQTMRQHGYYRSPEEINTRIKNLKCLYNRIKKDVESGVVERPTWKHYTMMDEIMTRPIFGRQAAQERMRQFQMTQDQVQQFVVTTMEEGDEAITGLGDDDDDNYEDLDEDYMDDDEDDDDDIDEADEDSKARMRNRKLLQEVNNVLGLGETAKMRQLKAAMNNATTSNNSSGAGEARGRLGEKIENNSIDMPVSVDDIKSEEPLLVPKEEPIDVEDIEFNDEQLNEYQATKVQPPPTLIPAPTANAPKKVLLTSTSTSGGQSSMMAQNICFTSQPQFVVSTNTQTNQGGRISLVPTNYLIKPPNQNQNQQQKQILYKSPQIMYTSRPNATATTNSMQVPIQATSGGKPGMPMKVLLVNRLQNPMSNDGTPQPSNTPTPNSSHSPVASNLQPNQTRPPPNIRPILPKARPYPETKPIPMKKPGMMNWKGVKPSISSSPSFRILLQQLVRIETQNLEVNRQRLDVEREKLEFEKSMGEKILLALAGKMGEANGSGGLNKKEKEEDDDEAKDESDD